MITTIAVHEKPSHAMTPDEMHYEVRETHADCTLTGCAAKDALWRELCSAGHLPLEQPEQCPACARLTAVRRPGSQLPIV